MSFTPYIHFQGQCREAMTFYADVFGGTLELTSYADGPPDMCPPHSADRIMHSCVMTPTGPLFASDFPAGMDGDPQKAVSVSHAAPDIQGGQAIYDRLADGADIIMPFGETFFSPGFGMLKDRFGTHWMIMVMPADPS